LNIGEKKYDAAINFYETILEKFLPNDLRTRMFLAKAYYRKGDFERCKELVLNLLGMFPNVVPLKFNLALCLY
jgi:tetratricopeptide (TPR) repeat protein